MACECIGEIPEHFRLHATLRDTSFVRAIKEHNANLGEPKKPMSKKKQTTTRYHFTRSEAMEVIGRIGDRSIRDDLMNRLLQDEASEYFVIVTRRGGKMSMIDIKRAGNAYQDAIDAEAASIANDAKKKSEVA